MSQKKKNSVEKFALFEDFGKSVFVDSKTNARTIALPFRLPDGTSAVLMVCRLKDENWEPKKEIKSIKIIYD